MPRELHQVLYEAQQAIREKKDYSGAVETLETYLEKEKGPPHALVYFHIGLARQEQKRDAEAEKAYRRALELDPHHQDAVLNLAGVLYRQNRYNEAAEYWEKAAAMSRRDKGGFYYQAAAAYYHGGRYKDALRLLEQLNKKGNAPDQDLEKNRDKLHIHTLYKLEKYDDALGLLPGYLDRHPEDADAWLLLGQTYLKANKPRQAGVALKIAYTLKPPSADDLRQLAHLFFSLGIVSEGLAVMETCLGPNPDPGVLEEMAQWFTISGKPDQAIRRLDQANAQAPSPARFLEKGRLLYDAGRYEEALAPLEEAVRLDGNQGQAHLLLGLCALETNHPELARRALDRAAETKEWARQARSALEWAPILLDNETVADGDE